MTKKITLLTLALAFTLGAAAQENSFVHKQADGYEWPTDPAVLEKLDAWQDLKFGVLMHWGLYSVPGIVESWNIAARPAPPTKATSSGTGGCPRSSIPWISTRSSGRRCSKTPV